MPVIALSQRIILSDTGEVRDAVDQALVAFSLALGFFAVPVPNNLQSHLPAWLDAVNPQAIILSGGENIGIYPNRDATEFALLDYAQQFNLPLLGICRGMQVLATAKGEIPKPVLGHVRTRHELTFVAQQAWASSRIVNSYHQLCIENCPPEYTALAVDGDGYIEAFRHVNLPWLGIMWHPEREKSFNIEDLQLIGRCWQ